MRTFRLFAFLLAAALACHAQNNYTVTGLTCESSTIAPGESKQCTAPLAWVSSTPLIAVVNLGGQTIQFGLLVQLAPYACAAPLRCSPDKLVVPAGTTTVSFTVSYPAATP